MGESATPPATSGSGSGSGSGDHRIRTLAVIGVVANVLGVVTAVESVLRRDVLLFVLTLTAVLLLAGFWLWYRRTRLAVALLALGCLLLGGVVATQLNRQSATQPTAGSSTATPPASAVAPSPTTAAAAAPLGSTPTPATPTPGGTTATDPDAPRTLVERSVVLPRFAAVDVDRPNQQVIAKHSDGATDGLDLYHDWGQVRSDNVQVANGPNVYPYSGGNPAQAYAGCVASATGSARASFTPGADFCFRTSEGRLGFATITNTRADQAFVVYVVVWDATGA
ncbi:hypothetical protein AB0F59_25445 [Micromonospora lupini]|uniref:hypothetical protein n=1 Tax=Micromonospora lupini TaxID=285679 RepID=UPI0033D022EC